VQRAVLQEAEAEMRDTLAAGASAHSSHPTPEGPWQGAEGGTVDEAREALKQMQEDLRRQREDKAMEGKSSGFAKERGQGDWANYQPPSAVLAQVAASRDSDYKSKVAQHTVSSGPQLNHRPTAPEQPTEGGTGDGIHSSQGGKARALPAALLKRLQARGIVQDGGGEKGPSHGTGTNGGEPPADATLPPGWEKAMDPTYNHEYYYNASTGERSWVRPGASPAAAAPAASAHSQLPQGWVEAVDPASGATYYCNAALGLTQWTRPMGASSGIPALQEAFQASDTFTGPRLGYVFKSGPLGPGYYLDTPPAPGSASGSTPPWIADTQAAAVEQQQEQVLGRGDPERKRPRETRQERVEREQRERRMRLQTAGRGGGPRGGGRGRGANRDELDPMDPSAYSDAPQGGWSLGLEGCQPKAADTTAGGPLFQQRPYPSPGSVLRANKKMMSDGPDIGPTGRG